MQSIRELGSRTDLAKLVGLAVNQPKGLRRVDADMEKLRRLPTAREVALDKAEVMMRQLRRTREKAGYGEH